MRFLFTGIKKKIHLPKKLCNFITSKYILLKNILTNHDLVYVNIAFIFSSAKKGAYFDM